MKTRLFTFFFIFWSMAAFFGQGQLPEHEFKLNYVRVNEESSTVEVFINAKIDGSEVSASELQIDSVFEAKAGAGKGDRLRVRTLAGVGEDGAEAQVATTILFLLDRSGSMGPKYGNKIVGAKRVIKDMVVNQNLQRGWTYFSAFSETLSPIVPLDSARFDQVVGTVVPAKGQATHLNNCLDEAIKWIASRQGRKVVILLTDGKDVALKNPGFDASTHVDNKALLDRIAAFNENFQIYTIGYGNKNNTADESGIDEPFLMALANSSKNKKDRYGYATAPKDLMDLVGGAVSDIAFNIKLGYQPRDLSYAGDRRVITIPYSFKREEFKDFQGTATIDYAYGAPTVTKDINPRKRTGFQPVVLLWGLLIVGLTLAILVRLFPIIAFQQFKRKHVMKYRDYRKKIGLDRMKLKRVLEDPYTGIKLEDNDDVVAACEHVMTLESWFANGDKCVYYPRKCGDGVGNYRKGGSFFSQQGPYRLLNWLWFGMLGGLLSWLLYATLDLYEVPAMIVGAGGEAESIFARFFEDEAFAYASQMIVGFSLGVFLTLALATVEELGQSKKFNIGRILLRGLIGAIIVPIVFFIGQFIQLNLIGNPIPASDIDHVIIWVLLGTALGWVTTIKSSIEWQKGLKGGALASVIAFFCFIIFKEFLFSSRGEYANMFGFMIFGAILGAIIVTVVERLENFELEFLSPADHAGRKVGISKWLRKDGDRIKVGTAADCDVFIKWKDKRVMGHHAEIFYDGKVYIKPLEGETLVNGVTLGSPKELEDKDEIRLSRDGETMMRFLVKEKTDEPSSPKATGARYDAKTEKEIKDRIKITPRR